MQSLGTDPRGQLIMTESKDKTVEKGQSFQTWHWNNWHPQAKKMKPNLAQHFLNFILESFTNCSY